MTKNTLAKALFVSLKGAVWITALNCQAKILALTGAWASAWIAHDLLACPARPHSLHLIPC